MAVRNEERAFAFWSYVAVIADDPEIKRVHLDTTGFELSPARGQAGDPNAGHPIVFRDGSTCQYCQTKLPARELTLDHVVPRSRGGGSTWENLVASCCPCNNRKGDRTPQEARMPLTKQPRQIGIHAKHRLLAGDEKTWERYLFC